MKRKGLLAITGCGDKRFETFGTRDQLPFPATTGKWNDYTLEDAFRLRLMIETLDHAGGDIETALYLAGNGPRKLPMHPLNYPSSEGEMWVAAGKVTEPNNADDETHSRFTVAGRLQDISPKVRDIVKRDFEGSKVVALVCINVSAVADHVRQEALDFGLPEGNDYTSVWEHWEWPEWVDRAAMRQLRGEE